MPKIQAPTLAEHRVRQRRVVLDAARAELQARGYADLTFSQVAARTGLARTSLYEYFGSKEDLLVALCEEDLPAMETVLARAMARAEGPRAKVEAWIRAQLRIVASGGHLAGFAAMELDGDARERIMRMHAELTRPLADALRPLGGRRSSLLVRLLQGVVDAGSREIRAGRPPATVSREAVRLALDGLGERIGPPP